MLLRRLLLLLRAQRHATKIAILTRAHMATVGLYLFAVAIQPLLYYAFPVPVKRTVNFARLWVASFTDAHSSVIVAEMTIEALSASLLRATSISMLSGTHVAAITTIANYFNAFVTF